MSILGLHSFDIWSSFEDTVIRLPCPLKAFGPEVKSVISLDILRNKQVLRNYETMTYLNINWEKDHAMINTHLYY